MVQDSGIVKQRYYCTENNLTTRCAWSAWRKKSLGNVSNRYSQTMVTVALPRVAEGGEHGLLLGGGEVAEAPHHAAQGVGHPDQGAVVQGQTVQAVEGRYHGLHVRLEQVLVDEVEAAGCRGRSRLRSRL